MGIVPLDSFGSRVSRIVPSTADEIVGSDVLCISGHGERRSGRMSTRIPGMPIISAVPGMAIAISGMVF
jgi:hypothetical protein